MAHELDDDSAALVILILLRASGRSTVARIRRTHGSKDSRSELHVLEGSALKGYVLVLGHDHYGSVTGLDCGEKIVCRYWWGRENALLPRDYTARLPGARYGRRLTEVKESRY